MLTSFRQLILDELTEEDLKGIAIVVDQDPDTDPQGVYDKLASGMMVPWRLETPKGNVIITVEIRDRKRDRVLYVWFAAGNGLLGNGKYVTETLMEFAKLNNCTSLETVTSPLLAKYFSKMGFKPTHVFVSKELD